MNNYKVKIIIIDFIFVAQTILSKVCVNYFRTYVIRLTVKNYKKHLL